MPLKHNDYSLNKVIKLVQNATTELSDDKLFCNLYKSVVGFEQIGRIDAAINLNGVNITDKTWEKTEKSSAGDSFIFWHKPLFKVPEA